MNKIEAIEALQKEYHYSQILVEDEFIKQDDGTTERNKIYDIADAFGIDLPVITFQPDPSNPKGPMPNHTQDCLENEDYLRETVCPCWGISYTGIAVMDVVDRIGQLYNVYSGKFGRGFAQREKLGRLHKLMTDIMEIPKEKLEEMAKAEEAIKEKTGIIVNLSKDWVEIPMDNVKFRPSSECFDNAIATGFLASSTVTGNDKWAENWMYMYSKLGVDYFKNRNTRNYIEVPHN